MILASALVGFPVGAQEDGFEDSFEEEGFDEEAFLAADDEDGAGDGEAKKVFLHGSFENQLTGMLMQDYDDDYEVRVYNYIQLRVDLDAELPMGMELRSDAVVRLFAGDTALPLSSVIPKGTLDAAIAADPRFAAFLEEEYELENDFYLDNAYLKVPIGPLQLTLGKQPLGQGAGYLWNPTDVFTVKDMLDPTYEKEGDMAFRLMIPMGDVTSVDLVTAPDKTWKKWTAGGRLNLRAGPISMAATSYFTRHERTDYSGSLDAMMQAAMLGIDPEDAIITHQESRVLLGGELIADVKGVRLWAEGAYNFMTAELDDWWELTGGAEYFFPFETHLMVEYYHYGEGPTKSHRIYDYDAWMGMLSGELKMLGQDFLFESIDHPVADFWTIGLSSFQSLTDGSAVITGDVRWEFVQGAELWFMVAAGLGDRDDFFGASRGQAWLRLKAYF